METSDTLRLREDAAEDVRKDGSVTEPVGEFGSETASGASWTAKMELLRSLMVVIRSNVGQGGL